jgi:hypothetical protein
MVLAAAGTFDRPMSLIALSGLTRITRAASSHSTA